ncbi:MAG: alpha-N-arabinofuranosidase, partial [bacterium]
MELNAEIKVNAKESYPVEEMVFGHFIEHLGRCIRDGIWDERELDIPREFGMVRKDVFDAMKALRPPVIRYPGGCFSDTYHWRDGIGPTDRRPRRFNRAWWRLKFPYTAFENNHFGTDEFVELCQRLGAEPYININFGSGSPKEAAEWVEYCNAPTGTKLADERAENGHPKPYGAKFWGIANEVWGFHEVGFCISGAQYARRYMPFHEAMKAADPEIKTVAVGSNRWFPLWNKGFLRRAGRFCDYLSVHEYVTGPNPLHQTFYTGFPETERAYYAMVAGAEMLKDTVSWARGQIVDEMGEDSAVKIAFDEWNAWWGEGQLIRAENYTLRDGIMTACTLSHLVKMSPFVGMANFA